MTKEFLERCLAEGMSLEKIGALVGRDPSTVSYHLKNHGLKPVGHDVHAPKGKVDPDRLREMVESGASIHGVAEELGVSYSTARYWVRRLGLETRRMARLRESQEARANGERGATLTCRKHGKTAFFKSPSGGFRCRKCRSEAVSRYRRRVKQRLIDRAGGACVLCGYDRFQGALEFHHLDPERKTFTLSRHGVTRAYSEVVAEADKMCAPVRELPCRGRRRGHGDSNGGPAAKVARSGTSKGRAKRLNTIRGSSTRQSARPLTARLRVRFPPPELVRTI
jgi:transposase-like protein